MPTMIQQYVDALKKSYGYKGPGEDKNAVKAIPTGVYESVGSPDGFAAIDRESLAREGYGAVSGDVDLGDYPEGVPLPRRINSLPQSVNTNLAAYDKGVTLPPTGLPSDYKNTEIAAGKLAEKHRAGAGFSPYQTVAPNDPNKTGATGLQMSIPVGKPIPNMTYESFMADIGNKLGVTVRPALDSANLPGTPGYSESFRVDAGGNKGIIQGGIQARVDIAGRDTAGVGPLADGKSYAAMVDGTVTPKITLNAQRQGDQERAAENARQLTPGNPDESPASLATKAGTAYDSPISAEVLARETSMIGGDAKEKSESFKKYRGSRGSARQREFAARPGNREMPEEAVIPKSPISEDRMRARAAFLDPNVDSMTALRRAEGEMGLIKQGGRSFARDESAEGGLREISQKAYRSRMAGGNLSEAMEANPMAKAKDKAKSRIDKLSGIGPVADGLEYATSLGKNVGPVADGLEYAQSLGRNVGPFADPNEYLRGLGRN